MNSVPWDEAKAMPSLVDHGDGALSTASSVSKLSDLLPQKLQFNGSGDSTDASTCPSVTAEGNPAEHEKVDQQVSPKGASGSKQLLQKKRKKITFSKIMKTPFRRAKSSASQAQNQKKPPYQAPHTLNLADDRGNVECYILDAHAIRLEQQEKAKGLPPVGLVSDAYGNVECRALGERSPRTEEMKPPVEAVEEEQKCNTVALLAKEVCPQPSSDAAMMNDCYEETVKCSFYDQIYSQLMDSLPKNECDTPSNLDKSVACIDQENLNLPDSKGVMDGISKEVQGGLQFLDGTLDCVVRQLFPEKEDMNSIQCLSIEASESIEVSDTQAEI